MLKRDRKGRWRLCYHVCLRSDLSPFPLSSLNRNYHIHYYGDLLKEIKLPYVILTALSIWKKDEKAQRTWPQTHLHILRFMNAYCVCQQMVRPCKQTVGQSVGCRSRALSFKICDTDCYVIWNIKHFLVVLPDRSHHKSLLITSDRSLKSRPGHKNGNWNQECEKYLFSTSFLADLTCNDRVLSCYLSACVSIINDRVSASALLNSTAG